MHHFLTFNLHNLSLIIWQLSEDFGSREKGVRTAVRSKTEAWVCVGHQVQCRGASSPLRPCLLANQHLLTIQSTQIMAVRETQMEG